MLDNDIAATQGAPDSESETETTPAATEDTNAKGAEREAPEAASDDDPGEPAEAPEAKAEEAHADDADDDSDRKPKWVQKGIDSLTKARHEAERRAAWAQSYAGPNAAQIALGAGLGAWAGKSGIEGALERLVHGTGGKARDQRGHPAPFQGQARARAAESRVPTHISP